MIQLLPVIASIQYKCLKTFCIFVMIMNDIYIIFKTPMGLQIFFLLIENKDTAQNVPLIHLRELSQFYFQLIHYELLASKHLFFPLKTELCKFEGKAVGATCTSLRVH